MKKQRKYKKINLGSLPNQPESSYVMSSFRWVFLLKPNRYGWEASFPAGTLDPKLKNVEQQTRNEISSKSPNQIANVWKMKQP